MQNQSSQNHNISRKHWFNAIFLQFIPTFCEVIIASVVINLLTLASPIFVRTVYDRVIPNNATDTLFALSIGILIVYIFDFILRFIRSYFIDIVGKAADNQIAGQLFEHLMFIRAASKPKSTGVLAKEIHEFETLKDVMNSFTLASLIDLPFAFLFVLAIRIISPGMVIVPIIAIAVIVSFGIIMQFFIGKLVKNSFQYASEKHAILIESINCLETIQTQSAQKRFIEKWIKSVENLANASLCSKTMSSFSVNFSMFVQQIAGIVMIIIGCNEIQNHNLTLGGLIACSILGSRALSPMSQITSSIVKLHQSYISYKALNRFMCLPEETFSDIELVNPKHINGKIEFKNVTFQYPEQSGNALENITFGINPKERVGIIGKIGSGKSSIAKLILNLYSPQKGHIHLDDIDISRIEPSLLRKNIGYVPQDVHLFKGTLEENIALSIYDPSIRHDEYEKSVLAASKISGADTWISSHPMNINMKIGENSYGLSGGQRQTIAIARAFLSNPSVVLMDEPTGSMDNTSEARFISGLLPIINDITLIIITHKTSLLSLVTRLIVLDQGKIIADGPKQKVLEILGGVSKS